MSHPATSEFLDGLQSSKLLDESRIDELRSRPEATWGDVSSLTSYAQQRGWLTPYQVQELNEGRGDQLVVHGYRIFDKVEDGPGGTTFKALHPALLQPVSLRVLRSEWLAPADTPSDYVTRAHAASLAQSPHLATVLDAGTLESGPYVVQEYVDGCDLFRLVNEMGALPVGLACEYVRQAAVAVKAAHNCGVAHGDVSPHTLLLAPVKRVTEENGDVSIRPRPGSTIKLVELGLTPQRPPVGELTYGESDRLGPIAFFAPERMTTSERSKAGDVYGLGATLYFLLTTQPPHAGDSPVAVMLNLQQAEPTPLELIKPELPAALTDLVRRLLSRDPSGRPSAAEAVEALSAFSEPSARPHLVDEAGVLLAHETGTHPAVPSAVPVARDLDRPDLQHDSGPYADPIADEIPPSKDYPITQPLPEIQPLPHANGHELMPEIQPLDEHHEANGDHLAAFGHTAIGADAPRAPRPRTRLNSRNKMWILVGLGLQLIAILLWIVLYNILYPSSHTPEPEQKNITTPTKAKAKKS